MLPRGGRQTSLDAGDCPVYPRKQFQISPETRPLTGPWRGIILSLMTKYDAALSQTFAALADPTRRGIMARLADGPKALMDLAAPTGFALPTVLRHVMILESAGLIRSQKIGRSRICHAAPDSLDQGLDWLTKTRQSLISQTDRLETYAKLLMKDRQDDL